LGGFLLKTLKLKKPVIAVAGSSGKTTTKEMIASILKTRWKIYKSAANRNNRQHMMKHASQIKPYHRAAVLEFGMSYPGHLRQSCHIIQPNMAIVTMVGTAHIGNVGGSIAALIKAKSDIIKNMKPTGKLFLNADDRNSRRLNMGHFRGKIIKVGINHDADYKAENVRYIKHGMTFNVQLNQNRHDIFIPIFGEHNVYNALFAIAVSDQLGFSPEEIKKGLKSYPRPPHRLRIYRLKSGSLLIDDTFNANPNSVKAAIDVLSHVGHTKNISVLGNMSELGKYSRRGHKEVGRHLAKRNVTNLLTYGEKARLIGNEAIVHGFPRQNIKHSSTRQRLHRHLKNIVKPGSTILVKGSHDQKMIQTVKYLQK